MYKQSTNSYGWLRVWHAYGVLPESYAALLRCNWAIAPYRWLTGPRYHTLVP